MGKIRFSFAFVLMLFALTMFGYGHIVCSYSFALLIHESAHWCVAKAKNIDSVDMYFSLFGARLNLTTANINIRDEILIALAGPVANFILILITVAGWWVVPISYAGTLDFVIANATIGLTNLLPIYPMDGGRILVGLLRKRRIKILKVMRVLSIVLGLSFILTFVFTIKIFPNYTLLLMGINIFICIFDYEKNAYFYSVANCLANINNVIEQKVFYVPIGTKKSELIKYLSSRYYAVFYFVNKNGEVKYTLDAGKILK